MATQLDEQTLTAPKGQQRSNGHGNGSGRSADVSGYPDLGQNARVVDIAAIHPFAGLWSWGSRR